MEAMFMSIGMLAGNGGGLAKIEYNSADENELKSEEGKRGERGWEFSRLFSRCSSLNIS